MKQEKPISICVTCKKEFQPTSHVKILKYCSKKCQFLNTDWRKQNSEWRKKINKDVYSHMGVLSISKQGNGRESSIEKKLYDYLLLKGILFERQYIINGKFVVDAYIPSMNLAIEADGEYWHSLPQNIRRDRAKNAYLDKCGYNLLRLSEMEIKNNKFVQKLERRLI